MTERVGFGPIVIKDKNGNTITNLVHTVLYSNCVHCKQNFKCEDVLAALGLPFNCLLHIRCLPYFNYKYPHKAPLITYYEKSSH